VNKQAKFLMRFYFHCHLNY